MYMLMSIELIFNVKKFGKCCKGKGNYDKIVGRGMQVKKNLGVLI